MKLNFFLCLQIFLEDFPFFHMLKILEVTWENIKVKLTRPASSSLTSPVSSSLTSSQMMTSVSPMILALVSLAYSLSLVQPRHLRARYTETFPLSVVLLGGYITLNIPWPLALITNPDKGLTWTLTIMTTCSMLLSLTCSIFPEVNVQETYSEKFTL